MPLEEVFELQQTPECINTYFLHAAAEIDGWEMAKTLPNPIWNDLYAGQIEPYDARGKEFTQVRTLVQRELREAVSFCSRWSPRGITCAPTERDPSPVRRPGMDEEWNYLYGFASQTCWYKPEDIARALVFMDRIKAIGEHLITFKRDLYAAAYQAMHVVNSKRKFLGALDTPAATEGWFGEYLPGTFDVPWYFADLDESCGKCVDVIYVDPSITDVSQILPLQTESITELQSVTGYDKSGQNFEPVTIITDVDTQMSILRNDPWLTNANLYGRYGNGASMTKSLTGNFDMANFVTWKNDKLPLRYYHDATSTGPNGELVLRRVEPFLDRNATGDGQYSDLNPDYRDARKAPFQIDVVWDQRPFIPRRPSFGTEFGKMSIDDQKRGQFQWINTKDNTYNRTGDRGYFFIQDDMMFSSNRYSAVSAVILKRRPAVNFARIVNIQTTTPPTAVNEVLVQTCADMAPKSLSDEACAVPLNTGDDPAYGGQGYAGASYGGACNGCQ